MVGKNIFCLCLLIITLLLEAQYASARQKENEGPSLTRVVKGVASVEYMPWGQYSLLSAKDLSKSTQFGIKDVLNKKWLMRVDHAHGSVKSAHININRALTGVRDPHLKIPNVVPSVLGGGGEVLRTVGNAALGVGLFIDGVRVLSSVAEDVSRTGVIGKETVKTTVSIGGVYAGGVGGAYAGNTAGGWVGGTIGSLFGGIGAVPGAAIGSLIGGLFGGLYGSIKTSEFVDDIVN